jgi:hypothetical protein
LFVVMRIVGVTSVVVVVMFLFGSLVVWAGYCC